MPLFTVHWKTEMNNWAQIEADTAEDALSYVKNGGVVEDMDCDESTKRPFKYYVDDGATGQGTPTKIN